MDHRDTNKISALRSKLAQDIVETGKYQELQQFARHQLIQEHWHAKVRDLVNQAFRERSKLGGTPSLERISQSIESQAIRTSIQVVLNYH
jgi:hypothetical protein